MMFKYTQNDRKKICCLQMKFAIIKKYSKQWDMVISDDIIVVFIYHNMIIEYENDKVLEINKVKQNAPQKKRFII
jgi:hypothetical protein